MTSTDLDPLVLDLVEWIGSEPRPYVEVIDAWRTSCPRLTVWEEALERGFVERRYVPGRGPMVTVTAQGLARAMARRSSRSGALN